MMNKNISELPIPFDKKFGTQIEEVYTSVPSPMRALLGSIGGCSPYLYNLLIEYKDWLIERIHNENRDIIR